MDSILAIGVGLVLRIVVDVATDNDDRVGGASHLSSVNLIHLIHATGVLVGLWEGVVLNHFVRRMPRSFDPYLGFGFRIFVDFLFTQSISRLALVALWALVGMLLADIAPNFWRDSGLRHLYRQVRKDVRHVQRAVPRIRIKNDLPSVRLFNQSRSTSLEVSGSIRSDRAAPSRSTAPSPAPMPDPPRRQGRSPPGTFPDVSGWSETGTDISILQERIRTSPGPSPALIPSREHAAYGRVTTTDVGTSQTRTTTQNTTIRITQTQNESISLETVVSAATLGAAAISTSLEPIDDPLRLDPPMIPDDWVDVNRPTPAQANEPVVPFQPDPDATPEPQPGPSMPTPSRSGSILAPPPAIDIFSDTPDINLVDRASQPPDQIPLPESRAASVIGGVFDQPQPRSVLRDSLRSRVDKATSEIGVDHAKSLVQPVTRQSTKTQSTLRSLTGFWTRSRHSVDDADAPEPPPKETPGEPAGQSKLDVGSAAQGPELQIPTPTQVDPPASILTQPGDAPPLLLAPVDPEPEQQQEQPQASKPDQTPASAGVDSSPAPLQGEADKGDTAGPSKGSLFDLPSPSRSPPPPFTEFAGVPEGPAAGETPAEDDPVTQDEPPTELTEEQKAAEDKRIAFLLTQVQELERSRADLQAKLDKEDDPTDSRAKAIESDLEDAGKTLNDVKARIVKKKFSGESFFFLVQGWSLTDRARATTQSHDTRNFSVEQVNYRSSVWSHIGSLG